MPARPTAHRNRDLDPGTVQRKTSITIRYYHALGADRLPTSDYELFETLVLTKDRRDASRKSGRQ
jgi:hypothetical protein